MGPCALGARKPLPTRRFGEETRLDCRLVSKPAVRRGAA